MAHPLHTETRSKIVTKASIELDIETAFSQFASVAALTAMAKTKGVELTQTRGAGVEVGAEWQAAFVFGRKKHKPSITVVGLDRPTQIQLFIQSQALTGHTELEFKSKQADLTEVKLSIRGEPKTVGARLKLYAARLAKNRIRRRVTRGLRKYCRILEENASSTNM